MVPFGAMVVLWNMGEAGSTWCWTGILLDIFYVVYPHVRQWRKWDTITEWKWLLPIACFEIFRPSKHHKMEQHHLENRQEDVEFRRPGPAALPPTLPLTIVAGAGGEEVDKKPHAAMERDG